MASPQRWTSYIESCPSSLDAGAQRSPTRAADDVAMPHLLRLGYMERLASPALPDLKQCEADHCRSHTSRRVCGVDELRGKVWLSSRSAQGSRDVQAVLETAADAEVEELALELRGHVLEATRCRHANHVLQKCIGPRAPRATRAIAQELMGQGTTETLQVAKHRYGCRIVQRILEFGDPAVTGELSEILIGGAKDLCTHAFGNYVMQQLLVHGSEHHSHELVKLLRIDAAELCASFHAPAVIAEALRVEGRQDVVELALALAEKPDLLSRMARSEHGLSAAQRAMHIRNISK